MLSTKKLKKLPDAPGVYFFKNAAGQVLYIGKATSLHDRARSYFTGHLLETRGPLLVKMMTEAIKIDFAATDSVLEALILEANLIKKHQPPYNTAEKDDKSFNYVIITKEDFPRVLVMRGRELEMKRAEESGLRIEAEFGPFTQGSSLREALRIVRKIFPFRDRCTPQTGKPCFNRQIGLCPGVCSGEISKQEYRKIIKHIKLFFEGRKKTLMKSLEKEMRAYAKAREFEKVARTKRTIFALGHIQDVALIKTSEADRRAAGGQALGGLPNFRVEAYDIAHMAGRNVVGVMIALENGEAKRSDYRKFKIRENPGVNDTGALKEILRRRFNHLEWPAPQLIVIDGGKAQKNAADAVLKEFGIKIDIVSVVKDERHRPREILGKPLLVSKHEQDILIATSEAHRFAIAFHRNLREKLDSGVKLDLAEKTK